MKNQPELSPLSSDRIVRLDVLRAVAIIAVFVFHYGNNLGGPFRTTTLDPIQGEMNHHANGAFARILDYGYSGVALFFVISGFCIHYSFLRHRDKFKVGDFYWRRFLRIYPPYLIALLFFSALGFFKIFSTINLKMFLSHLFLVHDFFDRRVLMSINAAFWSLAVEWQLYLLFPLVLLFRRRANLKTALVLSLALCLLDQLACALSPAYREINQNRFCATRPLDSWCVWVLGACLAESHMKARSFFHHGFAWLLVSLLMLVAEYFLPLPFGARFLGHGLFFAVATELYLQRVRPLALWERLLVPIGLVSYSIYLWHMPLVKPVSHWLHAIFILPKWVLCEVLFFIPLTALLLSPIFILSYFLFERRLPRLLGRWISERRAESVP